MLSESQAGRHRHRFCNPRSLARPVRVQTLWLLCGPLAAFLCSAGSSVLLARHTFKLKRLLQEKSG
jgi:hypothetical protein